MPASDMKGSFSESHDDWLPQLYQEKWDAFVRLATLLLADQRVAEAAVIAAFVTSYRRDPRLHSHQHAVSYLRTAVVNKARGRQPAERDTTPPQAPDELAYWCLRGLPARQREVLVLKFATADLSDDEIAEILGMSVNGVHNNETKGLTAIGETLRPGSHTNPGHADPRVEAVVRSALETIMESIRPNSGYDAITSQISRKPRRGLPANWIVALACLVALGLGILSPLLGSNHSSTTSDSEAAPAARTPQASDQSLPTVQTGLDVFYLGRDDGLIHRELRDLPTLGDLLGTAVGAVLNVAPLDPNYTSGWAAGQVNRASVKGKRITIDLSASAFSQFKNGEQVQRAIQQLVVTATAAVGDRTGDKSVRILVDGSPNLPIIGKPATDFVDEGLAQCARVWVDTPQAGADVSSGKMTISGFAQPTVSVMTYEVRSPQGNQMVTSGQINISATDGDRWRPWSATVTMPKGEYDVVIREGNRIADEKVVTAK
ncbi:GerMN domain-containing protein [Cutibacterium avidum]|uniref:Gmad2 immunoglobulin-like domain-containing protein n=1 Tax=Cutibacterium avidum TaxID=33010 RepID=UPI00083E7FAB|nr:Gmad2 immunoglobulin-like domain-containing protein [Cutibacterium avidum]AOG28050.1 RNA polymerase subunit sigma-70 [Cutibacterium avidum]QQY16080.1 GerMN domain-containing protein [Cutibacterium avidum]